MLIKYRLSEKAVKAEVKETGFVPAVLTSQEVDLSQLPEDGRLRAASLVTCWGDLYGIDLAEVPYSGGRFEFDFLPRTIEDWGGALYQFAKAAQARREAIYENAEKYLENLRGKERDFNPRFYIPAHVDKIAPGLYREILAECDRLTHAQALLDKEQKECKEKQDAAEREEARVDKACREHERATWIAEHGSDYLKRAVEAGYDCQRLYVQERTELERAGFHIIYFENGWTWKERCCPSEKALDMSLAIPESRVVWVTGDPRTYEVEDYAEYEGILIEGFLGEYTLILPV